jgi:hypothetical protein
VSSRPDDIEPLITRLVQQAPDLDASDVAALTSALESIGSPLAQSIARIVELVAEQLVDPGIALPALAEACATLVAGVHGTADARALEAARYRIETLQPVPDRPPQIAAPDVPIGALRKKRD